MERVWEGGMFEEEYEGSGVRAMWKESGCLGWCCVARQTAAFALIVSSSLLPSLR